MSPFRNIPYLTRRRALTNPASCSDLSAERRPFQKKPILRLRIPVSVGSSLLSRRCGTLAFLLFSLLFLVECRSPEDTRLQFTSQGRDVPAFSSDRTMEWIRRQVEFGPRSPGSEGHRRMGEWLVENLKEYAGPDRVYVQPFTWMGYEGQTLELRNILASFNLQSGDRILIAAHWDTRPRADEDPDRPEDPILGADDGASGVGVLLELARIMAENPPPVGVDLIFFDGEDYGEAGTIDDYFLGSRYWGRNPPVEGYRPRFGILLDMVGGRNARFPKESFSMRFAPQLVNALWQLAGEIGYGDLFVDEQGALVYDDHVIVQRETGIPMIDLIHHGKGEGGMVRFPPWWHTHRDNLEIIDPGPLQAVGDLLLELIYNRM